MTVAIPVMLYTRNPGIATDRILRVVVTSIRARVRVMVRVRVRVRMGSTWIVIR